jgi:hypothetical protein
VVSAIALGNKDCSACHATTDHYTLHQPVTVPPECSGSGCHAGTNLIPIHSNSNCSTCHQSTDPNVVNAIATGNKNCSACHPTVNHMTVHEPVTVPPNCSGTGCHAGTNLIPIHSNSTCATCHSSTDPNVVNAIATHNKNCVACHPSVDHVAAHNVTYSVEWEYIMYNHEDFGDVYWNLTCTWCHQTNLAPEHNDKCYVCHSSTDPAVVYAIATGNKNCAACHPTRHGNADPAHQAIVEDGDCNACHAPSMAVFVSYCIACHDTLPMGP